MFDVDEEPGRDISVKSVRRRLNKAELMRWSDFKHFKFPPKNSRACKIFSLVDKLSYVAALSRVIFESFMVAAFLSV